MGDNFGNAILKKDLKGYVKTKKIATMLPQSPLDIAGVRLNSFKLRKPLKLDGDNRLGYGFPITDEWWMIKLNLHCTDCGLKSGGR